jgi:hypothetical protein
VSDPLKKGDRVRVSELGRRNGIAVRRYGFVRLGTIVRIVADCADVKWDYNRGVYSIYAGFIVRAQIATVETGTPKSRKKGPRK